MTPLPYHKVVLEQMRAKRKPRKCFTYKALQSEAEGTRTLNLRIDSLKLAFVSTDGQTINN